MQPQFRSEWKAISRRLLIAVTPLVIFLGFNFEYPVPPGANLTAAESINIPVAKPNEPHPFSGFLNTFYAHPIDYLAGDISLHESPSDLNPLRAIVNEDVLQNIGNGNSHERTNGIRWSIIVLSLFAMYTFARGRFRQVPEVQRNILFFSIFALFTFWLSLSPNFPIENWGASYFLFWLMPKIRVASRSGINVHFALLMITGFYLSTEFKWRKYLLLPGVFALLMIVDYFPSQDMPMAPMRSAYKLLQRDKGPCGTGMAFPFTSGLLGTSIDYANSQRLRGSDCPWLNRMGDSERIRWLTMQFPPAQEFMDQLTKSSQTSDKLVTLAKCVPLNWIIFHEATPRAWAAGVCSQLGWLFNEDMSCIAPDKSRSLKNPPERCL